MNKLGNLKNNDLENELRDNDDMKINESIKKIEEEIKLNPQGLLPAILQDNNTNEVLMLGYMNLEALKKTLETGRAWFWSRSRQKLWLKGETSGNYQLVRELILDCDKDTMLVKVDPEGPTCHTGNKSCFYNILKDQYEDKKISCDENSSASNCNQQNQDNSFFSQLYNIISDRKKYPQSESYTSGLLEKGIDRIGKKVGEEASEVIIAGKNEDRDEIIYESADLIYHLFVLLVLNDITLTDIENELANRHKKS